MENKWKLICASTMRDILGEMNKLNLSKDDILGIFPLGENIFLIYKNK